MNKSELVKKLQSKVGGSKAQSQQAVDALFAIVTEELGGGGSVVLAGFGTFGVHNRKARKGTNPSTGEPLEVPAKRVPKFKAGKTLADRVATSK